MLKRRVLFATLLLPVAARAQTPSSADAPALSTPVASTPVASPIATPADAPKGDDEKEKDDAAEAISDRLKDGKLVKYGFTAGAALALHIPMRGRDRLQRQFAVSAMPYVAWLPFRWLIHGDVTKAYCASVWVGGDAQKDADALATRLAIARTKEQWPPPKREGRTGSEAADWKTFNAKPEDYPATVYDATGWELGDKGRCAAAWLPGMYIGIPANFTVNAKAEGADATVKAREFAPVFSAGLAFAPYAYFSVLLGGTLSAVKGDDEKNHYVGSFVVALGGNLDLAGLLLK